MNHQKQRRPHTAASDLPLIVSPKRQFDTGKATPKRSEIQSEQQRLDLAGRLANCGGRPVLEALRAVKSGESIDSVLRDFARLPAGCDRPRLPGEIASIVVSGRGTAG